MIASILRTVLLLACLSVPAAAMAQSTTPAPGNGGPGMMWGAPGMMGNGYRYHDGMGFGMGPGAMGPAFMTGCSSLGVMMSRRDHPDWATAWLDGQLAFAHSAIGITETQEPAWAQYVKIVRDRSIPIFSLHRDMMSAMWRDDLSFDEALALHIQVMEAHLAAMKATRDAALALYDALSPDQKKKAAWALSPSLCMMQ
jgi:hypothetical protein